MEAVVPQKRFDPELEKERARIASLVMQVSGLQKGDTKAALQQQLSMVESELRQGNIVYARQFRREARGMIFSARLAQTLGERGEGASVRTLIAGLICYAVVIAFVGVCVVVVHDYQAMPGSSLVGFVRAVGLLPIFATVSDLGAKPEMFLWGVLGGAGAVASMIRRIDSIVARKSSSWMLFALGLFGPMVGSLAATVAVKFVQAGLLNILTPVPLHVIAFFAGFSEQFIDRLGATVVPPQPTAKTGE